MDPQPPPSSSSARSPRNRGGGYVQCCCSQRFFSQNKANFERSAVPSRFMYYHCGSWLNFSRFPLEAVRKCFSERKPIIEVIIDGSKYIVDFKKMLLINYSTGNWQSVSWIDKDGNCFFPNGFFCDEELCDSEYENDDKTCSKSDKAVEVVNVIKPVNWPNSKLLRETEKEYVVIKNNFLNGIMNEDDGVTVTSISQCNGDARHLIFQYQLERTKAARGTANVTHGWYGSSAKVVENVLTHGFGLHSKVPVTEVYGVGVYLSPLGFSHLSANLAEADDNGVKHLILCRVILGKVEKVKAGSQQYLSSCVDFDTGSDDPSNPRWHVVWSNNANLHILPESVVSFKPSVKMQVQPREICSLEKLFSMIGSSLPPSKVQEISNSYRSYRTGGMTQDDLLSKFRLVVGDGFLQSAVMDNFASQ